MMILSRKEILGQLKKIGFFGATILFSLFISAQLGTNTETAFTLLALAILTYFIFKNEKTAIFLAIFLPVLGELVRLPFGPENGLLLSDFMLGILAGVWFIKKTISANTTQQTPKSSLVKPAIAFLMVAILSLIQSFLFLKPTEVISGSMYLIRLIEYFILYLVVLENANPKQKGIGPATVANPNLNETPSKKITTAIIISATLIAILGFIQLVFYPDLGKLEELGWDPHINRLVSTWLDPNFIAGFLALIISITLSITFYTKKISHKFGLYLICAILTAALVLTYSRSGYLAIATVIILIGILKSPKILIGTIIISTITISLIPRVNQRTVDLIHSAESIIFNTSENPDATARLRIKSWEQTMDLITSRPILGSGYNTLRYVKYNEGYVEQTNIHSASGSDSSMLTILATTGILGLIPFCWLYFESLKISIKTWKRKQNPAWIQGLGLGLFCGTCALLIHSIFVNSLLFPQIMVPVLTLIGVVENWSQLNSRD